MARKPSVEKKIEKISGTCTKELSELQEMLEKPDSVDNDSLVAVGEALREMNKKWIEGFSECSKALQAKTKREPSEPVREIVTGSGAMGSYEEDAPSIDEVLKS